MYAEKRCVARLVGALLLACGLSHSAEATVGFKSAVSYPVGTAPLAVAVGDFNGDGRPDVVVANDGINPAGGWLAGTVSILLGNGDGTFQDHLDYAVGIGPERLGHGECAARQRRWHFLATKHT